MTGIDRTEFIRLFHEMFKQVKDFVYYKTGDIDLADDIAQDTFLRIWEKRGTIRTETIKPLVYTIASNLCKNRFEHNKVVLEFNSNYKPSESSVSPEFEMEMKEFNQRLKSAINGLSEKSRTVFLMNRIDGCTYNEIAENLGLSVKAIEKRMKNALDELKKQVEYKL
jgi:RNA polymerase sigma-70 factor (ECF subfamily)